ncbi:MAG: SsrA-binding protein SmpB [Chitinophagaceae bacterium]|jgi:SsrA-binding protein
MEIRNRSAFHEYFIEDKYDAGMVLTGTEVKALRSGKASFNDSFCTIDREEVWLRNLHISEYEFGSYANHPPMRERKLLLRKREIKKLVNKLKDKGYTLVPLKIWFNEKGFAKIQIGLAKGKKLHDKRASIKEREAQRELKRFVR